VNFSECCKEKFVESIPGWGTRKNPSQFILFLGSREEKTLGKVHRYHKAIPGDIGGRGKQEERAIVGKRGGGVNLIKGASNQRGEDGRHQTSGKGKSLPNIEDRDWRKKDKVALA